MVRVGLERWVEWWTCLRRGKTTRGEGLKALAGAVMDFFWVFVGLNLEMIVGMVVEEF